MTKLGRKWELLGQHMLMCPQKALFWEEENTLIVADLHIGKVGHFRKSGIAIPRSLEQEDLGVLSDLLHQLKPASLIFLGDLFHSEFNNDWEWLVLWRELFPSITMTLVRGNHDILHDSYYRQAGFSVVERLDLGPFTFTHEPAQLAGRYVMSGHIHPAVRLRGKGRQSLVLSCFYFSAEQAILPAFGRFTGNCCIPVSQSDITFAVLGKDVVAL
ncbi:ligase-associated DNA damage response endonuclease PdeM [Arcticibacter sp. MXS-1]|uniref:ligase-associated DNA damage response endonuclease PdeM n=1 Tax=Arcticibacter sp. MXS-1 TaxID=3341726 RepID=UPI0035A8CF1B